MIKENEMYTMVTLAGNLVVDEEKYGIIPKNRPEVIVTQSLREYFQQTDQTIIKFSVMDKDKQKLTKIRNRILDKFKVSVTPVDIFSVPKSFRNKGEDYPNPFGIDIMPENITKAEAIKVLTKELNINVSKTIAFGDGMNDIEMFDVVGYKVAMGNAVQELKAMADMITDTNNESGVAVALNKIFSC